MPINIPESDKKRVVIVGAGFAGLTLARRLDKRAYQVVLIDKHNYHQFQPLFYQVAMSGLEPSSIAFPLRKIFQRGKGTYIRITEVLEINPEEKRLITPLGYCNYDMAVLAMGADTNYYDLDLDRNIIHPLKSVGEALSIRNAILEDFENALITREYEERQVYLDIVIVGGGPTGVEVAGALAEMKKYILPKDYAELNVNEIDIYLVHAGGRLLPTMSEKAGRSARIFLEKLGVKVMVDSRVVGVEDNHTILRDGSRIRCGKVIWAAGVHGNLIPGIAGRSTRFGRIPVDHYHAMKGEEDLFVIGDLSMMETEAYPDGHPQVAQTAIQQAKSLAQNLNRQAKNKPPKPFQYRDKGSMATVGRNKAVVDLKRVSFKGFWAWAVWLTVHLFNLLGVKNRIFVFLNWVWSYFTYDQSLRLIIRPRKLSQMEEDSWLEHKRE